MLDKKKVLELLENERERAEGEKLEEHNVVVEFKKIEGGYGVIKGFVYRREKDSWKLVFRGALLLPINPEEGIWKDLKEGESKYWGIVFDTESKTLGELIKDFIARSLKEGKLQDFVPKA